MSSGEIYNPFPYQEHGTRHMLEHPKAGAFFGMGLGKTVMTLTAAVELIYERWEVRKILVIAPLLVAADVWTSERDKWQHTRKLRMSQVLGTERERIAGLAVAADIYVINVENVIWLVEHMGRKWCFDMVVFDESSKFKSHASQRFKKIKTVLPKVSRVVILTGTPAPNGLHDLWSQVYLLDGGKRLGETIGEYRARYFNCHTEGQRTVWELKTEKNTLIGADYYKQKIYERVGDICISMEAKDYLDLPECTEQNVYIRVDDKLREQYEKFEREQVLQLFGDGLITADNSNTLSGKLRQFTNGAVYDSEKTYHEVHSAKLDRLAEDVEAMNGEPFLLFYNFRHDRERIMKHLAHLKPYQLDVKNVSRDVARWNAKQIPFMILQWDSAAHGLNLQYGGHYIGCFGLTWNLESYLQAIARLNRQGQKYPVMVRRYMMPDSIDEKVLRKLTRAEGEQSGLMDAVRAIVQKWIPNFSHG